MGKFYCDCWLCNPLDKRNKHKEKAASIKEGILEWENRYSEYDWDFLDEVA